MHKALPLQQSCVLSKSCRIICFRRIQLVCADLSCLTDRPDRVAYVLLGRALSHCHGKWVSASLRFRNQTHGVCVRYGVSVSLASLETLASVKRSQAVS